MIRHCSADVIIAGAGPAGAVTALLLARAGHDVLLIDRAAFPRPKPCGDCLSLGATALLERLGLLDRITAATHTTLSGWRLAAPDGSTFQARFDTARGAIAIERIVLDDTLVRAALDAGARLEQGTVTDVLRDGARATGVIMRPNAQSTRIERHARMTVAADGLRSVIAARLGAHRRVGRLRKLSLTLHPLLSHPPEAGELHLGDGYCAGLAAIDANGRCNLTIVADATRFGRAVAADARAFVRSTIDRLPHLRDRVADDDIARCDLLASGPFDRPVSKRVFDGAVLTGDAAGYYDPFTGQGVFQAIAAAELLAPHIDDALRTRSRTKVLRGYERDRARMLRGPAIVQRGIEAVISRPHIANRIFRQIDRAPAFARSILAVTGDCAPVASLLSPHALFALLYPSLDRSITHDHHR